MTVMRGYGSAQEQWTSKTRYSQLVELQRALVSETGLQFPVPPKKWIGNLNPEFILERRQQLEAFLQKILAHHTVRYSVSAKRFFDAQRFSMSLGRKSDGEVSMYLRGSQKYKLASILGNIGRRYDKAHFLVTDHRASAKKILTWTPMLKRSQIPREDLRRILEWMPKIDHRNIAVSDWDFLDSERGAVITVLDCQQKGSLKDLIYRAKNPVAPYPQKYSTPSSNGLDLPSIRLYGYQVLEGLQFLFHKGLPYGMLHAGNVLIGNDGIAKLSDLECGLLGYAGLYDQFVEELRKIQTLVDTDVYSFGHLMYEMSKGEPLMSATCETGFNGMPAAAIMEQILVSEAIKSGIPKISALLDHQFFQGAPTGGSVSACKITKSVKEILGEVTKDRLGFMSSKQQRYRDYRKAEKTEADKRSKKAMKTREAQGVV